MTYFSDKTREDYVMPAVLVFEVVHSGVEPFGVGIMLPLQTQDKC